MNTSEQTLVVDDMERLLSNCSQPGTDCNQENSMLHIMKSATIGLLLVVVLLCSIALNSLVFLLFFKKPKTFTISNRFLLNLTACNCLTTVFIIPFALASLLFERWMFGLIWCQVTGFVLNFVFAASTLTLVVISLDRYCAIVSPLHYRMKITRLRCYFMIAAVWLISAVISIPPVVGWNRFEFQTHKMICTVKWDSASKYDSYYNIFLVGICFALPLAVMIWVYTVIYRTAKIISQKTRRNSCAPKIQEETNQSPGYSGKRRRSSSVPIMGRKFSIPRLGAILWYREEWRTAVTSIIVFLTFICCWLPYFTVIILETFFKASYEVPPYLQTLSIALALSSSALDPLVYVFRSHQTRQEIREILLRKQPSADNIVKSYTTPEIRTETALKRESVVQLVDNHLVVMFT